MFAVQTLLIIVLAACQIGSVETAETADTGDTGDTGEHPAAINSALSPAAAAEEDDNSDEGQDEADDSLQLHYGTEVDFNRRYVWRGLIFSDGPVLQPMIYGTAHDVTVFLWSNLLLADGHSGHFTTIVPGVSYTAKLYGFNLEVDALWYIRTDRLARPRSSAEIKGAATYYFNAFFEAHTRHFVDITRQDGAYFGVVGPGYKRSFDGWELAATAELAFASAAFNSDYFDVEAAAFNMVQTSVHLRHSLGDLAECTLHAEISELIDPALRQQRPPLAINFGLTVGVGL